MTPNMTLVTGPASEPLSLAEVKAHLHIEHDDEDAYLESLLVGARRAIERRTGLALIEQTWDAAWDRFPCVTDENPRGGFVMPRPPLLSVTSITYTDEDGNPQTLAADQYTVNTRAFPGEVVPAYEVSWPATRDIPNAVVIRFKGGYGDAAEEVDPDVRDALRIEIADRYWRRRDADESAVISSGVLRQLLANARPYVV